MSNISTGVYWAWMIAANEAYLLNYDKIEPFHFLLGALKLIDISKDLDNMLPDMSVEEKAKIVQETSPLFKLLVKEKVIPLTQFRRNIRGTFIKNESPKQKEEISRSNSSRKLFEDFASYCKESNQEPDLKMFLFVILSKHEDILLPLFKANNVDLIKLRESLIKHKSTENKKQDYTSGFGRNLTKLASEGKLSQAIGRDKEVREIGRILLQKNKPNALVIGEAGVGKTAVIETLALMITQGNVPADLRNKELFELSLASLLAGAKYKGEYEERINKIISEATQNDIILFIDEFHNIMGAGGGSDGTMDVANILKPALARGDIHVIGATTIDEYRKHIEKDPAIERRFQLVYVNEPDAEQCLLILTKLSIGLEIHYNVKISEDAIKEAIRLSIAYMPTLKLPDKAISVIESACSRKLYPSFFSNDSKSTIEISENVVTEDDVYEIISKRCNIPIENISNKNEEIYLNLEKELKKEILGQEQVINEISETIRMAKAGLNSPNQPRAAFFFVGPTGVGKTALAKALSKVIYGKSENIIRFDMSEFQEKFHVNKFLGAPPGYVGFGEEGILVKQVRNNPFSVILFDEIEKAHEDIQNVFLQILDNGTLTASDGRAINFRESIIIFTSNLGAAKKKTKKLGFGSEQKEEERQENRNSYLASIGSFFKPEFINRLHKMLVFNSISKATAKQILDKIIDEFNCKLQDKGLAVNLSDDVKQYLLNRGYSAEYGVRNLQRIVSAEIAEPLSRYILLKKIKDTTIQFIIKDNKVDIENADIG